MLRDRARVALVLAMILALVVSPVAGLASTTGTTAIPGIDTYSASDNVEVWERAPLPFRLDTDDAAKTIQNGALDVEYTPDSTGELSLRKQKTAVYRPNTAVSATFQDVSGAGTGNFVGEDTKLVIARLNPSGDGTDTVDNFPTSVGEAQDFFDEEDANENATFYVKDTGSITADAEGDGKLSTSITFPQSGAYALFLTTGNVSAPSGGGDISVNGPTTVIGMDGALVEEASASVTSKPSTVTRGNTASFDIATSSLETTNVSVMLYDTSTWVNSRTLFSITEQVNDDLSTDDLTIYHSIADVNGVADLEDSYSQFGVDVGPTTRTGTFSAGSVISELVSEANDETSNTINQPKTVATDDTVIDASMVTQVNVTGTTTVDLQTFKNWSTGDYTYVIVTGGSDAGDIKTATGSLKVEKKEKDTGGGGDDGGFIPPDDGDDDEDDGDDGEAPPPVETPGPPTEPPKGGVSGAAPGSSVSEDRGKANVKITGTTPGADVTVDIPVNETELDKNGVALNRMSISTSKNTSASLNVSSPAETDVEPVSQDKTVGYIQIDEDVDPTSVSGATYQFTVTENRLEERGVEPENVALFRYEDNGWRELPTTLVSSTDTRYTFEAESPGLSLYAISERGAAQPNIEVTSADVEPTSVEIAEPVEVTATVENTGNAEGTFTATLQIDGEDVTSKEVTVGAGATETVTFEYSFGESGERTVAVSGTDAGTVDVSQRQTSTTTTTPPTTTTTTTTTTAGTTGTGTGGGGGGGNLVLFGFVFLLLVGGAAVVAYLYSEGYFEQ